MAKRLFLSFVLGIYFWLFILPAYAAVPRAQPGLEPDSPGAVGSVYSPETHLCCNSETNQRYPAAAYNTQLKQYLIVNHAEDNDSRYISGVLLPLDSGARTIFLVSDINDYDCCLHPDVVYSWTDNKFLVVWQQYNKPNNRWEIYGRWIKGSGPELPFTTFKIADSTGHNLKYPRVAWNSFRNEYLVVWQQETAAGFLDSIGFRRVAANGGFPAPAGFVRQANSPSAPDVTYNVAADQYLAVWSEVTPPPNYVDIYAAQLDYKGAVQNQVFPVRQKPGGQVLPAVTTNEQDRYLVVWQDDGAGNWDIYGQFLDVAGNQVGGEQAVAAASGDETHPGVVANGLASQYVVAYQNAKADGEWVEARLFRGAQITPEVIEIAVGALGDNRYPAVGTHLSGYFFAYQWVSWEPGSVDNLYGRFWSPAGSFLPAVFNNP